MQCSGERPQCKSCRARSNACVYDTSNKSESRIQATKRKYEQLQGQHHVYANIFHAIQTRSHPEALVILSRIRQGVAPAAILQQLTHGDLRFQLSLIPETRYRYEFPFVRDMPAYLLRPENRYLKSPIYELTFRSVPEETDAGQQAASRATGVPPGLLSQYLRPYHAAEVFDSRLDAIEPSKWTGVAQTMPSCGVCCGRTSFRNITFASSSTRIISWMT